MRQKRFGEKKIKSSIFKERTEEHFKSKKGLLARYEALDTSLDKLRKEYANLKSE